MSRMGGWYVYDVLGGGFGIMGGDPEDVDWTGLTRVE